MPCMQSEVTETSLDCFGSRRVFSLMGFEPPPNQPHTQSVTSPSGYYTTLGEGRVRRAMISLVISTGMSIDRPASTTITQSCRLIA